MPPDDLAARMYPTMADAVVTPAPAAEPAKPAAAEAAQSATEPEEPELTPEEELADRMYPEGGSPPPDGEYRPFVADVFNELDREARELGATPEDLKTIAEGQTQVVELLKDLGVGGPGAKELAHIYGRFQREPLDEDALGEANSRAEARLHALWGPRYKSNLQHARNAYKVACERIPWFEDATQMGAGSDPAVIVQMAAIGRRMARKSKA